MHYLCIYQPTNKHYGIEHLLFDVDVDVDDEDEHFLYIGCQMLFNLFAFEILNSKHSFFSLKNIHLAR